MTEQLKAFFNVHYFPQFRITDMARSVNLEFHIRVVMCSFNLKFLASCA